MLSELGVECRAIDEWPGERTKVRIRAPFKAHWGSTVKLLGRELKHLTAKSVVLMVACEDHEIRVDRTRPRADARVRHPGVILAFKSKFGPLRFATDRYLHWKDNCRAIGLGLEALRRVDRYGITKRAEQYRGWKQLPRPAGSSVSTSEEAGEVLARYSGFGSDAIRKNTEIARDAWRAAILKTHPDKGGEHQQFVDVQSAARVLGLRQSI